MVWDLGLAVNSGKVRTLQYSTEVSIAWRSKLEVLFLLFLSVLCWKFFKA